MPPEPLVTVAICTYNRADLLSGAIESACQQTLAAEKVEILVIDNASSDSTPEVVRGFEESDFPGRVQYLFEPAPGLGKARNTALQHARGMYLAYLDDDARAAPDWLERAVALLEGSDAPECVGGVILPFYTSAKPVWFKDSYESRSWGGAPRRLKPGETFSGSNMIWRTAILRSLGGFGEGVGVQGAKLSVGEETAAFSRLWDKNSDARLTYDPALKVTHWVPPYKMRVGYSLKRAFAIGQSDVILHPPSNFFGRFVLSMRSLGSATVRFFMALIRLPRYSHLENWVIEELALVSTRFGTALGAAGIFPEVRQN